MSDTTLYSAPLKTLLGSSSFSHILASREPYIRAALRVILPPQDPFALLAIANIRTGNTNKPTVVQGKMLRVLMREGFPFNPHAALETKSYRSPSVDLTIKLPGKDD